MANKIDNKLINGQIKINTKHIFFNFETAETHVFKKLKYLENTTNKIPQAEQEEPSALLY